MPAKPDASAAVHSPASNFRSPPALARFFLVTIIGLVIDLWTKVWAFDALFVRFETGSDGRPDVVSATREFLPGLLHFHVTANHGAVFGIGQGQRPLFVVVSVLAIGFLTYLFATSGRRQRFYQVVLGMLLAGVLGNMYDRIRFGYVRDMIWALPGTSWPRWVGNMTPESWHWTRGPVFPWIFNVADTLLCVGVALMLVYSLLGAPKPAGDVRSDRDSDADLAPAKS